MSRLILAIFALALAGTTSSAADRVTGLDFATRSEVIAPHAMAATSQPLVTQIALDIMRAGGNAIDAAIAANAALGLMEPTGNGMGGDLFAIVWDAESGQLYGLNASGRAPMSLTREWFLENDYKKVPAYGPLPVSVPGAVDGWFELHERFGSMPMSEVLAPAVGYAREGFPVSELIAYYWDLSVPRLSKWPGFVEQYTIDGRAPRKGEIWRNENLAHTLETVNLPGLGEPMRGKVRDSFVRGAERIIVVSDRISALTHEGEMIQQGALMRIAELRHALTGRDVGLARRLMSRSSMPVPAV